MVSRRTQGVLVACVVLGLAVAPFGRSHGHVRTVGGSLIELLVRSDGVALVEVSSPTEDRPVARTRVRTLRALGGQRTPDAFPLRNALSPMRYAAGQRAIVTYERDGDQWRATQLAGEGVVFASGDEVDATTMAYLADLWTATHDATPDGDLGLLLRRGLRLPHPKLRLLAALDIAEIAHHQPGLSDAARAALLRDLDDPALDEAVRLAISRATHAAGATR